MSLHGSTRTGESLSALGERLTAELSRLASEIDDIVASTRLAASAYDRTETAILDLLTDLDRR